MRISGTLCLVSLVLCQIIGVRALSSSVSAAKKALLASLDKADSLNTASSVRSQLVEQLTLHNPTSKPGSVESFRPYSAGTWKVIYAPHIASFRVFDSIIYNLRPDGSMTSHARFCLGESTVWLSVAGTYGSQDDGNVCRVDFDKTWIKVLDNDTLPYASLTDAPATWYKNAINTVGKLLFIPQFSIFPVSFLDDELIVFDFELLGTRICARKVGPPDELESCSENEVAPTMRRPILDQILASALFSWEMNRVEASSTIDNDGRYGEPMEWSEASSFANQFSKWVAGNPLGYRFKQWVADTLAGDYDRAGVNQRIRDLVHSNDIFMFSFTTCPFCRRAKDALDGEGIRYQALELDEDPNGNAIRAELGRLVQRTSMPSIFVRGTFVGGCNDGPGLLPLLERGELGDLLKAPRQSPKLYQ